MNLFVDVNLRKLVRSATDPAEAILPMFDRGDNVDTTLFFVSGGSYLDFSTQVIKLGVGRKAAKPTGGTFTLTFGTDTTTPISVPATSGDVQMALEALPSIGVGQVLVTSIDVEGGPYRVEFTGTLADTNVAQLTYNAADILPTSSIILSTLRQGGGGVNELQIIILFQNPVIFQDTWTALGGPTFGMNADVDFNTVNLADLMGNSEKADLVLEIETLEGGTIRTTQVQKSISINNDINKETPVSLASPVEFYTKTESDALFFKIENPDDPTSGLLWQSDGSLKLFISGVEKEHWV